jgi:hypothetical protein
MKQVWVEDELVLGQAVIVYPQGAANPFWLR